MPENPAIQRCSFIFLTIENEDSALLHQQHTLASTKRNLAGLGIGAAGIGSSIYQQQQRTPHQQQQQHQAVQGRHADNDTMAAAAAAVAAQGMLPGSASAGGLNPFGQPASSGDFVYGLDGMEATDLEAGGMPQFALSPDTYDVRQRTHREYLGHHRLAQHSLQGELDKVSAFNAHFWPCIKMAKWIGAMGVYGAMGLWCYGGYGHDPYTF
ncbi:GM12372 [Drosophila sechellia]|uniref:GM12372 n=1 Tax=Drosophila sechellia TaxID=7238 RepID=B4I0U3_DROSE|nr:GM12372 [Drosophila sechellia]